MTNKIKIDDIKKAKAEVNAPKLLSASKGDMKGEIDIQWDSVDGAKFYVLQLCAYADRMFWIQIDIITKSSYTISGLKSGKKYCFRVAAVSSSRRGAWSDIIIKNAP